MSNAAVVVVGVGLLAAVCVAHSAQVTMALDAVPAGGFVAAVGLHVLVLVIRSEAWRVALAAVAGPALPRRTIHAVNASAFLAGTVQSHAALPTRVLLLGRHARSHAFRAAQIGLADVPIFLLEVLMTGVLLAAGLVAGAGRWWAAPVALGIAALGIVAARLLLIRFGHREAARGLAVLADVRRRLKLLGLVAMITGLTAVRIWLILEVCGLPHDLPAVATVFAALGVFGLLPLGPTASPGATLATLGGSGAGTAVAAGLVIGASSIAAVLVYALGNLLYTRAILPSHTNVTTQ